ncbi:MAG: helicase [Bacteroidales bacterium]|nr:helicase [Bacteroidales bacterium]
MSSKFFNNTESPLFDKFSGIARSMACFDIFHAVVGYFRSSGYFRLRQELSGVNEIRVLVGISIDNVFRKAQRAGKMFYGDPDDTLQQYAASIVDELATAPYSLEVDESVRQFCDDILLGRLELRLHATKNLHAKFYLCLPREHNANSDGWVIMGSSNLTDQGLGISEPPRYELNVALKDYDDVSYCENEFRRLWDEALPLTAADLQAAIDCTHLATRQPTPYELYMRVLIDHFGAQIEDSFVPNLPNGYDDLTYQRDAVVQGYQIMMRHGGCFIADVVGLGKTVVAAMIAQRFIAENGDATRILVVSPPAVRSSWEETFADFGIKNKYSRFVSRGSLDKVVDGDGYDQPPYYDLVIVDEAHNFRHDTTDNFDLLQRITKSPRANRGNISGRKRILLLSATPLNNHPEDIKNQLLLFQDVARPTIDGISNIADTFAPWIREYGTLMQQRDGLSHAELTRRTDHINQQMRHSVIEKVMVRRTRSNIKNEPRYSGEVHFPELRDPEERTYEMSDDVQALYGKTYDKLIDTPTAELWKKDPVRFDGSGLCYARYRAVEYCKEYNGNSELRAKHVADQLAAIYQTHMVKRLESSFSAFRRSLHTLLDATRGMIAMFASDKVIIAPDLNVKKMQADGMEIDQIIELAVGKGMNQDEIVFPAAAFQPDFLPMLQYDEQLLASLCEQWDSLVSDPKLELFITMIRGELFDRAINPSGKLVVFSESVDTINYLKETLSQRLGRRDILAVDSHNRKQLHDTIRANFDANYKGEWSNDYNIILTSDVLAEGVNLHRANVIVNYDSPWNASRLMQRIGRVNRIGSTANAIYNFMFYPSEKGDDIIELSKNSLIKLQSFHSALGEDTRIYSHSEIVREFRLYNTDILDDTDRSLQLIREVRQLRDSDPALYDYIKHLPCKSRCARNAANGIHPQSSIVYLSSSDKRAYYMLEGMQCRELSFLDAVAVLQASSDEVSVDFDTSNAINYSHVRQAVALFEQCVDERVELSVIGSSDRNAKEADAFLRHVIPFLPTDDAKEAALQLQTLVRQGTYTPLTKKLCTLARANKKKPVAMTMIAEQLQQFATTYHAVTTMRTTLSEEPDIVLSETFVGEE